MIETPRLLLRRFRPDDVADYARWLVDRETVRYLPGAPAASLDEAAGRARRQIDDFEAHWERHGHGVFAAVATREGLLAGRVGTRWLAEAGETEVLWLIEARLRRQGLAAEGARAALRHAFDRGLGRAVALAHPDNAASRRVMEKLGMTYERHRGAFAMTVVQYAVTPRTLT